MSKALKRHLDQSKYAQEIVAGNWDVLYKAQTMHCLLGIIAIYKYFLIIEGTAAILSDCVEGSWERKMLA